MTKNFFEKNFFYVTKYFFRDCLFFVSCGPGGLPPGQESKFHIKGIATTSLAVHNPIYCSMRVYALAVTWLACSDSSSSSIDLGLWRRWPKPGENGRKSRKLGDLPFGHFSSHRRHLGLVGTSSKRPFQRCVTCPGGMTPTTKCRFWDPQDTSVNP